MIFANWWIGPLSTGSDGSSKALGIGEAHTKLGHSGWYWQQVIAGDAISRTVPEALLAAYCPTYGYLPPSKSRHEKQRVPPQPATVQLRGEFCQTAAGEFQVSFSHLQVPGKVKPNTGGSKLHKLSVRVWAPTLNSDYSKKKGSGSSCRVWYFLIFWLFFVCVVAFSRFFFSTNRVLYEYSTACPTHLCYQL